MQMHRLAFVFEEDGIHRCVSVFHEDEGFFHPSGPFRLPCFWAQPSCFGHCRCERKERGVHCTPMILSTKEETPSHRLGTYYLETGYGIRPSKFIYDRMHKTRNHQYS